VVEVEIAILYCCRPLEARVNLRIGTRADGPVATTVVSRIGELTNTSGGFTSSCCGRDGAPYTALGLVNNYQRPCLTVSG
jgi:hypothetical protein